MVAKVKTVKWALGGDEPEDLQDFLSNDDIVLKNTNKKTKDVLWPKKGPHAMVVRRLFIKPNKNGDDRITAMIVMQNDKKSEAVDWNGYLVFDGFNVTEQGSPYIKRFLRALGLEWKDFMTKTNETVDGDRRNIVQIGRIKFGEDAVKDPTLKAIVKVKPADDYNDDEHMEIQRYLPVADDDDDEEEEEEEEEEEAEEYDEDEDAEDEEDEEEEEDEEDDEEDEEEEDESEELREELTGMKIVDLKKRLMRRLKKDKVDPDDIDIPTRKAALVDFIVQVEMGEPPF